jgi:hypothetical protein
MAPYRHGIDREWAESLIGLRVKVPANWWNGIRSTELHGGILTNFDDQSKWVFRADSDGHEYSMAYDAVLEYADQESDTFGQYTSRLLHVPVLSKGDEQLQALQARSTNTYSKAKEEDWARIVMIDNQVC